jgi:transposase
MPLAAEAARQVRDVVAALGYTAHIRPRGEEVQAQKAGQQARRWVVERTHSWLNRFRHRLIRWAKKRKTTWPCSISPAPESPGAIAFLGDPKTLFG